MIHLGLSYWFYFTWVHTPPESIDGGPLGFLTWTIPTIGGTLACDYWMSAAGSPKLNPYLWSGLGLMTLGWLLSCGTTIYNVPPTEWETRASQKYADNPVVPSKTEWEAWQIQPAEPPFVPPPNQVYRETCEVRYFLSSLPVNVKNLPKRIGQHWNMENQLRWGLDVTFTADASQLRKIP